jgi:hypothetical protein
LITRWKNTSGMIGRVAADRNVRGQALPEILSHVSRLTLCSLRLLLFKNPRSSAFISGYNFFPYYTSLRLRVSAVNSDFPPEWLLKRTPVQALTPSKKAEGRMQNGGSATGIAPFELDRGRD